MPTSMALPMKCEAATPGSIARPWTGYCVPTERASRRFWVARQTLRAAEVAGRGIHAEVHVAPGTPAARGDPDQLRRVFENLIRNAWEAAGSEGTLRIDLGPEGERRVSARIEDNGPGIADDEVPHLFQPFRTTRQGGTGLGLALVHRIVESHGGEIRVDGRPGRGAPGLADFGQSG